jgi:putative hydrolase of the HAD superfamily
MRRAVLLDLDDTLIVEEPAAVAAFAATAGAAAERHPLDPRQLALDARACARELWHDAEVCAFGRRIGISSWEALWCRYEGDDAELRAMRAWAPGFRRDAWAAALGRQGVRDDELAPSSASASARSAARATRPSRTPRRCSTRCAATTAWPS